MNVKEVYQASLEKSVIKPEKSNSTQRLEPLILKKRIARSQNPSVQLKQAIEKKQ